MDETLVDRITDEVFRRLYSDAPAALLIGKMPPDHLGYRMVSAAPYDAIIIGSLDAAQLLSFSDARVLDALLRGIPVYLYEPGLCYRAHASTQNRALYAKLLAIERKLQTYGIRFYGSSNSKRLVTAEQARALKAAGRGAPAGAILTPMAREILGGGSA